MWVIGLHLILGLPSGVLGGTICPYRLD